MRKRSKKKSNKIIFTLIPLILLVICLVVLLLVKKLSNTLIKSNDYYIIETRIDDFEKNKKDDTPDYDSIGWLRVQGTNIDYPIIHANSYKRKYPITIERYVWITSSDGKFNNYSNIDGHNLFNLKPNPNIMKSDDFLRFEELMNFIYYDFAKKNLYFQVTKDDGEYIYKIFAVNLFEDSYVYASDDDGYKNKDEYDAYIKTLLKNSIYDYSIDVNTDDEIISLRTCSRVFDDENVSRDFVVSGRLVRKDEKVDKYLVKKNSNYKKIEKIYNGVDYDEEDV